jgi:hypothetical protein
MRTDGDCAKRSRVRLSEAVECLGICINQLGEVNRVYFTCRLSDLAFARVDMRRLLSQCLALAARNRCTSSDSCIFMD